MREIELNKLNIFHKSSTCIISLEEENETSASDFEYFSEQKSINGIFSYFIFRLFDAMPQFTLLRTVIVDTTEDAHIELLSSFIHTRNGEQNT